MNYETQRNGQVMSESIFCRALQNMSDSEFLRWASAVAGDANTRIGDYMAARLLSIAAMCEAIEEE